MICRTYTRIHRVRTVPLRLTNIYGPRTHMRHSQFGLVNWFVRLAPAPPSPCSAPARSFATFSLSTTASTRS